MSRQLRTELKVWGTVSAFAFVVLVALTLIGSPS